jgi:PII-like signaling protein
VSAFEAKLTAYFGERDRAKGRLVADALLDRFADSQVATSVMLRGAAGVWARAAPHSDRLLSSSESLPAVAVAIDRRDRLEALLAEIAEIAPRALATLESARPATGPSPAGADELKLTLYPGRRQRIAGAPAQHAIVAALHDAGVAGATVLLGVDGTVAGERRRATLLSRNADVPQMVIAVGEPARSERAFAAIAGRAPDVPATLERVRVCRRDGRALAARPAEGPPGGWVKLMVHAGEQSRAAGRPLHETLLARLRGSQVRAVALRGIWGFHGDHPPHGDRLLVLRRRVPVLTVVLCPPGAAGAAFAEVEAVTEQRGLVTSEPVPEVRLAP